jgi:AcrR family transcriptional regulator
MIELIGDGISNPTVHQVARQAGVSDRLIFNYFDDLEDLFCQATELQAARHRSIVAAIPPNGPVAPRILGISRQRRELFEVIGPVLRVAYSRSQASPNLKAVLAHHRVMLRQQLTVTFRPEITARGGQAQIVLEVVDLATGWQNWNALRFDAGHTAPSAEKIMVFAVTTMLC